MEQYKRKRLINIIGLLVLDGLFYGISNPNTVNLVILMFGVLLFALNIYVFSLYIISGSKKFGFKIKNANKLSLIITGVVSLVVGLETMGQLSLKDVIVAAILGVLVYFYLEYVNLGPKKD